MSMIDSLEADLQGHLAQPTQVPEPPPGFYLQIYRDAVPGATPTAKREQLARYCDQAHALGLPGVVFHGFPGEMVGQWDGLATLAADHGLLALASWGLDGHDHIAAAKGDLVGEVLARPTCAAGILDAEGQWDSHVSAADDMDEAGALALGRALRARAPHALVGDQPWYQITSHAGCRRTAKPLELGGPICGFPVDEFAAIATWGRFRQAYLYRSQGEACGYVPTFQRMDRSWLAIAAALRTAGLERPLRVTLQAYRWLLREQVHALLDRGVRTQDPVILWCEPWPDETCLRAIRAVLWMQREGYARAGVSAEDAVRAAQRALVGTGYPIDVDGDWGEETARAAGLW